MIVKGTLTAKTDHYTYCEFETEDYIEVFDEYLNRFALYHYETTNEVEIYYSFEEGDDIGEELTQYFDKEDVIRQILEQKDSLVDITEVYKEFLDNYYEEW